MQEYDTTSTVNDEPSFGIDQVVDALKRRKWLALIVFLCVATVGLTGVFHLPEIYRTGALVIIEHQVIPDALVRSTVTTAVETRLQTITEEIQSRSKLAEYIEQFDLYRAARDRGVPAEALAGRMRGDIEFFFHRDGRRWANAVAFTVGYKGAERHKIADVANFLASRYVEESKRLRTQQAEGISKFLSTQLDELRTKLDEQETRLTRFKEQHLGELPHQQSANLASMDQLHAQLEASSARQVELSAQRQTLTRELTTAQGITTDWTDPREAQLATMKVELAQLQLQYTERHPDVLRLKQEVAILERAIGASRGSSVAAEDPTGETRDGNLVAQLKSALSDVDRQLTVLQSESERLRERIEVYQSRVDNAPRVEQEYQLLSRDYDTTLEQYRSLLSRRNEAELAENMEEGQKGEQMRLVEPAVVPGGAAAPDRPTLYLVTLALSLGLAAGAIFAAEFLDSSFHSVDELRATGFSIVGSVPVIVTAEDRRRKRWAFAVGAACVLLGLVALGTGAFLYTDGNLALTSRLML